MCKYLNDQKENERTLMNHMHKVGTFQNLGEGELNDHSAKEGTHIIQIGIDLNYLVERNTANMFNHYKRLHGQQ